MQIDIAAKSFSGKPVLGAIRIDVSQGERIAILGPSGVGKTTLLRIVAGLDTDFDGVVVGADATAMVFQEPTLLPWRSAIDNIILATGAPHDTAVTLMAEVGLAGKEAHYPRQLSLGQQRRLSLARAFAARPDVLLMDEPFASLDPETAERMLALTDAMLTKAGAGLFFVTHAEQEATRLAARILKLNGQPARLA